MREEKTVRAYGIDIGTTSICLAVCEKRRGEEGRLVQILHGENAFLPGTYTQDPERILRVVEELTGKAAKYGWPPEAMDAVGISSQMHGILYVDAAGQAVSPFYTWKDTRGLETLPGGASIAQELSRQTGYPLHSGYGTVTHACLARAGEIPAEAVKLANIGDYLAMRLTGRREPLLDASMAASFGCFDLRTGDFDQEALRRAGIRGEFYPETAKGGRFAGFWRGVPVTCACGDNQASVRGALGDLETQIGVNVGTGSQVTVFSPELMETEFEVRPYFDRGYLYVGASLNGGKVYEKLAQFLEEVVFAFTGQRVSAYEKMEELGSAPGPRETLRVIPSLYGSRAGEEPGGRIEGLREENFHLQPLICAYIAGMAEELAGMYRRFPETLRTGRRELVASGNGLRKNPLLRKAVSLAFGLPLLVTETKEEAAAGAARAAFDLLFANCEKCKKNTR